MKSIRRIVVLFFSCLQLGVAQFTAFEDGKRYIYEYKTRVATGVAGEVKQFSGFGFTALLTAQSDGDQVVYQMSDLKYGYFNGKVDHILDEIPIDYERLPDERVVHVDNLEKPFWVEYDHGLIKAIYFTKGEDVAKHNNKKALAAIFQLHFKEDAASDIASFTTREDSIGGFCPTLYYIDHYDFHLHHDHKEALLNVTKIRQYDKCEHLPHLFYSTLQGYECMTCEQKSFKPLKIVAQMDYSLKGTREHYVIEHITATGGIDLTPFTPNGQSIISAVNQTFHLLRIEDAVPLDKPSDLEKHENLAYEFNNDLRDYKQSDLKEAHYFNRVYPFTRSSHVTQAESLLHQMEEEFKHDDAKVSQYVTDFIDAFSEFNYDEIEAFFNKYVIIDNLTSTQHILLEILPLVGTNPAILFALHLIEQEKIDTDHANEMIQLMSFYVKEPSQKLIEHIKEFGLKANVVKNYKLYISSHLAYGTLLFKACQENVFNPHPHNAKHYIPRETCTELIEELFVLFSKSTDISDRLLNLRVIANTRSEEAFNFLLKIVKGDYANHLKQVAIVGLVHSSVMKERYKEVVEVVRPFFGNREEDYVLRGYAFDIIMFFDPSPNFFSQIILALEKDPNEKLKSYIYNSFNTYVNTTDPCFAAYKPYFKHILQYIKTHHTDIMTDAINHLYSVYNAKYDFGRTTHFLSMPSNESILPRELYFRQSLNVMGYSFDFLTAGYSAQGQTFPEEILGMYGLGPKMLIHQYEHQHKNEFIYKTLQKLNLSRSKFRSKYYEVFVQLFNQDIYVTDDLPRSLSEKTSSSEFTVDDDHVTLDFNTVNYVSVELLLPNELGMPVVIKSRIPATAYIHGSLHIGSKSDEDGKAIGEKLEADLHTGFDIRLQSQVAVLSVLYGPLGYKLTTKAGFHIPLKGSYEHVYATNKQTIKYIPSKEPYDIFYYKTVPKTVGKTSVPIHFSSRTVLKQFSAGIDYFGVGFTYNFTFDHLPKIYGSYSNSFKSFIKQTASNENYYYFSQKWYATTRNLVDYALINPNGRPFAFNIRFTPSPNHPTTEFVLHSDKSLNIKKKYDEVSKVGVSGFKFQAELAGKGSVERKWNLSVNSFSTWPQANVRETEIKFKRSPIPNYDDHAFEICYSSNTSLSDITPIYRLKPADVNIFYDGHIAMGPDCSEDSQKIHIKALLQQTEEQHNLDRSTLSVHKKCAEHLKDGFIASDACWEAMKNLARLNKATVNIDYKNISPETKGKFVKLFGYFRHRFYNNFHLDPLHGNNLEDHIKIVANISYYDDVLDTKIVYPHQTAFYKNIHLPTLFPNFEPINVIESSERRFFRKFLNYKPATCAISGNYVKTFDGATFKVSLSKNYHLAFSDLSHIFVFFRAAEGGNFTKALYMYVDGVTFEIVPGEDGLHLTVDGHPGLKDGRTAYFFRINDKEIAVIYKLGELIKIEHIGYGFNVYFDGESGVISASYFYKANQQGICGNFDGEKLDEFQGPDGKIYEKASDFINSYAVEN